MVIETEAVLQDVRKSAVPIKLSTVEDPLNVVEGRQGLSSFILTQKEFQKPTGSSRSQPKEIKICGTLREVLQESLNQNCRIRSTDDNHPLVRPSPKSTRLHDPKTFGLCPLEERQKIELVCLLPNVAGFRDTWSRHGHKSKPSSSTKAWSVEEDITVGGTNAIEATASSRSERDDNIVTKSTEEETISVTDVGNISKGSYNENAASTVEELYIRKILEPDDQSVNSCVEYSKSIKSFRAENGSESCAMNSDRVNVTAGENTQSLTMNKDMTGVVRNVTVLNRIFQKSHSMNDSGKTGDSHGCKAMPDDDISETIIESDRDKSVSNYTKVWEHSMSELSKAIYVSNDSKTRDMNERYLSSYEVDEKQFWNDMIYKFGKTPSQAVLTNKDLESRRSSDIGYVVGTGKTIEKLDELINDDPWPSQILEYFDENSVVERLSSCKWDDTEVNERKDHSEINETGKNGIGSVNRNYDINPKITNVNMASVNSIMKSSNDRNISYNTFGTDDSIYFKSKSLDVNPDGKDPSVINVKDDLKSESAIVKSLQGIINMENSRGSEEDSVTNDVFKHTHDTRNIKENCERPKTSFKGTKTLLAREDSFKDSIPKKIVTNEVRNEVGSKGKNGLKCVKAIHKLKDRTVIEKSSKNRSIVTNARHSPENVSAEKEVRSPVSRRKQAMVREMHTMSKDSSKSPNKSSNLMQMREEIEMKVKDEIPLLKTMDVDTTVLKVETKRDNVTSLIHGIQFVSIDASKASSSWMSENLKNLVETFVDSSKVPTHCQHNKANDSDSDVSKTRPKYETRFATNISKNEDNCTEKAKKSVESMNKNIKYIWRKQTSGSSSENTEEMEPNVYYNSIHESFRYSNKFNGSDRNMNDDNAINGNNWYSNDSLPKFPSSEANANGELFLCRSEDMIPEWKVPVFSSELTPRPASVFEKKVTIGTKSIIVSRSENPQIPLREPEVIVYARDERQYPLMKKQGELNVTDYFDGRSRCAGEAGSISNIVDNVHRESKEKEVNILLQKLKKQDEMSLSSDGSLVKRQSRTDRKRFPDMMLLPQPVRFKFDVNCQDYGDLLECKQEVYHVEHLDHPKVREVKENKRFAQMPNAIIRTDHANTKIKLGKLLGKLVSEGRRSAVVTANSNGRHGSGSRQPLDREKSDSKFDTKIRRLRESDRSMDSYRTTEIKNRVPSSQLERRVLRENTRFNIDVQKDPTKINKDGSLKLMMGHQENDQSERILRSGNSTCMEHVRSERSNLEKNKSLKNNDESLSIDSRASSVLDVLKIGDDLLTTATFPRYMQKIPPVDFIRDKLAKINSKDKIISVACMVAVNGGEGPYYKTEGSRIIADYELHPESSETNNLRKSDETMKRDSISVKSEKLGSESVMKQISENFGSTEFVVEKQDNDQDILVSVKQSNQIQIDEESREPSLTASGSRKVRKRKAKCFLVRMFGCGAKQTDTQSNSSYSPRRKLSVQSPSDTTVHVAPNENAAETFRSRERKRRKP